MPLPIPVDAHSDSSEPTATRTGRVLSVNSSPGGIPKRPIPVGVVRCAGLKDDGHNHAKHRTPQQAISLLDEEDMHALIAEGFALEPGAAGENLTVRGALVRDCAIGDRLVFDGGVVLEITRVRTPCYVLDAIDPALKTAAIGRIGTYARVLCPGEIRPGEGVSIRADGARDCFAPERVVGAILVGGASSRMGRPKQDVMLPDGRTMLDAVEEAMRPIVGSIVHLGEAPGAQRRARRVLADIGDGDAGPVGGLRALAAAADAGDDAAAFLVCPCDMPHLAPGPLRRLLRLDTAIARVFAGTDGRDFEPLPLALTRAGLDAIAQRATGTDERSLHRLIRALEPAIIARPPRTPDGTGEDDPERMLRDVDTPEDLASCPPG